MFEYVAQSFDDMVTWYITLWWTNVVFWWVLIGIVGFMITIILDHTNDELSSHWYVYVINFVIAVIGGPFATIGWIGVMIYTNIRPKTRFGR